MRRSPVRAAFWLALVFLALIPILLSQKPPEPVAAGKSAYDARCAVCHGTTGMGDGPAAYLLYPKPRDFTTGIYKIRSTPSGSVPTDGDLLGTITEGMAGTAMPAWRDLPEGERQALVAYLKSLSPRFSRGAKPVSIAIPPEPEPSAASAAAGRKVYEKLKCGECHGPAGRGDGPSAPTLKDDRGYPIPPYDFTRGGRFKGGSAGRDIYRTFVTGMDGTPMPSYDFLAETDRWPLVHYVQSLSQGPPPEPAVLEGSDVSLASASIQGVIPRDPFAAAWDRAPALALPLRSLWLPSGGPQRVVVRSLHNGEQIGFLLEWKDAQADEQFLRPEDFRDAAAVQFSLSQTEPFFGMGNAGGMVNIWHWKADWQKDLTARSDVERVYPKMAVDLYPSAQGPKEGVIATRDHDTAFLTGRAAGNLFSAEQRKSPVEDLNATGLGTLTSQPEKQQNVDGVGRWQEGSWRVIFLRPLRGDRNDVAFVKGRPLPVALAIWDGSRGDRDGQKSVTIWYKLILQ